MHRAFPIAQQHDITEADTSQMSFLKADDHRQIFTGGSTGGLFYQYFKLQMLFLPAIILLFALWYDKMLFGYDHLKRKYRFKS